MGAEVNEQITVMLRPNKELFVHLQSIDNLRVFEAAVPQASVMKSAKNIVVVVGSVAAIASGLQQWLLAQKVGEAIELTLENGRVAVLELNSSSQIEDLLSEEAAKEMFDGPSDPDRQRAQPRTDLDPQTAQKTSKDWAATVGLFDDDPIMGEIIDDALEAREQERREFYDEFDNGNGSE